MPQGEKKAASALRKRSEAQIKEKRVKSKTARRYGKLIMPAKASKAGAINMGYVEMNKEFTRTMERKTAAKLLQMGGTLEVSSMRSGGRQETKLREQAFKKAHGLVEKKMHRKRLRGQRGVIVDSDDEADDPWLRVKLAGEDADELGAGGAARAKRKATGAEELAAITAGAASGDGSGSRARTARRAIAAALEEVDGAESSGSDGSSGEESEGEEGEGAEIAAAAATAFG